MEFRFINLLGILLSIPSFISFNISPVPNLEYAKPHTRETDSRDRPAYFGYSLLLRQNSILIGAPRANSSLTNQLSIIEPGQLYNCSVNTENSICQNIYIEYQGNIYNKAEPQTEIRNRQWLGASITGDINESIFMICAPHMKTRYYHLPIGICYTLEAGQYSIPQIYKPFVSDIVDKRYFYLQAISALGLGIHWIKQRNLFLIGAPAKHDLDGKFLRYNSQNKLTEVNDEIVLSYGYLGYSISAGIFDKNGNINYVIAAPRYEYFGAVIIVDENCWTKIKMILRGSQQYEYFGYSIITEDIDNDGISEVIVSAPFYSDKDAFEIGAVYVHDGKNLKNLTKPTLIPFRKISRGRFGHSLASLGDINLDGYNDIAVGCPYDGNGKVYIYQGSENGLFTEPVQILKSPYYRNLPKNNLFGFTISSGVDVDGNGLNDIAISSPNNDQVYLYKTYPILRVKLFFKNFPQYIHSTQSLISIESCIKFESLLTKHDQRIEFEMYIDLDITDKRIKFESGSNTEEISSFTMPNETKCFAYNVAIKHEMTHKPFTFILRFNEIQPQFRSHFCAGCAVVHPEDKKNKNLVRRELFIKHTCRNGSLCYSDLKIKVVSMDKDPLILNCRQHLSILITIQNFNDSAYLPQLFITNNHNLSLIQVPKTCSSKNAAIHCNLWNDRMFMMEHNQTITINATFSISNLGGSELIFNASVVSLSEELNNTDNSYILSIQLLGCSKVEIFENSDIQSQILSLYENQLNEIYIEKKFEITNIGPSAINNASLMMLYPTIFEDKNSAIEIDDETFLVDNHENKILFINDKIVNRNEVEYLSSSPKNNLLHSKFAKYNLKTNLSYQYFNLLCFAEYDQIVENFVNVYVRNISSNAKIIFNGDDSKIHKLRARSVALNKFSTESSNNFKVIVKIKINQNNIWNILKAHDKDYFVYKINFVINQHDCNDKMKCTPSIITVRSQIYEIVIIRTMTDRTPIWFYIVSFASSILIYLLIAFILYKIGFFKRRKKEQLNQLKGQSAAQQSNNDTEVSQPPVKVNESFEISENKTLESTKNVYEQVAEEKQ